MSSFLLFHCLISNLFNFLYFVNSVYRYSSTSSSCFLGRDAGSSSGTPSATAPTSWFSVPIYSTSSSYAKQVLAIQTLTLVIKPCRTFLGQALSPWHQADALFFADGARIPAFTISSITDLSILSGLYLRILHLFSILSIFVPIIFCC